MNWSKSIRQWHRWLSITFTVMVIANFVVIGIGMGQAPIAFWVGGLTLVPLFLSLFSGLYLFALPYTATWRRSAARGAAQVGE